MPERRVAIDTSVLVGLINPADVWHERAVALKDALQQQETAAPETAVILFDCVLAEAISVVTRRLHEKGHATGVDRLLSRLEADYPAAAVSWILPTAPRYYSDVLALIRQSHGALNFNDALIALVCRDQNIPFIASFDADFDALPWLKRIAQPEDLAAR